MAILDSSLEPGSKMQPTGVLADGPVEVALLPLMRVNGKLCVMPDTLYFYGRAVTRRPAKKRATGETMLKMEHMPDTIHCGNGQRDGDDEYLVNIARAMRQALQHAANYAMRHDNPAVAANEALEILRAELLWRFELLRSRQRQPNVIVPEPLSPATK